ncbi:microtubule-associated protein 1B-like [Corythoichthys intestinalis]|uniref:microtubule-associated protein 1B-like n=1 Tax=Corythoichthys intestinalis TaxID=161448 RepID=UPI0025A68383|nr:microtubule-associated protein 1B-like [Corythoichthys intestinalis]XP_057715694.1 microtubule-associated protein 1B-like [Corythoichthys intestinalis]
MSAQGDLTCLISRPTPLTKSPFELMPPPATVGFLKLSRPCCYAFPAGHGDCSFFAVNGFTVLVDGGSDPRACFWKLVRHLDRVDALLLTHAGVDNLSGINSFLERKAAETELRTLKDDGSGRLISPELGVVFFNAPDVLLVEQQPCVDNVLKSTDQAALTVQLLKKLDIQPHPMFRPPVDPPEPITLFQKMGVGQLDLYILSPVKNSQDYQTFMRDWPNAASPEKLALATLASASALLVWHPACPQEKVVRVLFPGVTPQAKLLQGLEKLKGLAFLQKPTVTTGDLERIGDDGKSKRATSQDSVHSQVKDVPTKLGKEAKDKGKGLVIQKNASKKANEKEVKKNRKQSGKEETVILKNGIGKKESPLSRPKNDNKTKLKKDAKNDSKTEFKKTKKSPGKDNKKVDVKNDTVRTDNEATLEVSKPEENHPPHASKTTTPEDMTSIRQLREETEQGEGNIADEGKRTGSDLAKKEGVAQLGVAKKPAKVVGFPSPLKQSTKNEPSIDMDLTPTEYTLLDGALRASPPSRSSPDNQATSEERTIEQNSSDSRPNSAGHTPYCLSPDDVWCNRDTLSRLRAQEAAEVFPSRPAQHNTREKHLTFLSLGPLKDGSSDLSPSVANTTTSTHSMPAEVSSPQSTEVDESLSMSLEHGPASGTQREVDDAVHHANGGNFAGIKRPFRSSASETGRPPVPGALHFEPPAHDVDLCLVSPCEFKHFKQPDYGSGDHNGVTPSESNAPICTEECPSTTADGVLDSDEDGSYGVPSNLRGSRALPRDPLPARIRDSPPLSPRPDTTMPVPQSDVGAREKKRKTSGVGKKTSGVTAVPPKPSPGKTRTGNVITKTTKDVSSSRTPNTRSPKPASSQSRRPSSAEETNVFVDLAYVPSGASSSTVGVDFFKSVRSSCYVVSGDCPEREKLMRQTLDALLQAKASWEHTVQVTLIPTFESASMQDWYQETVERHRELGVLVLGSNSTVAMQDDTFPACKIEF